VTRAALLLATWFGCGYMPRGPGTAGSLAAVAIAALVQYYFGAHRWILVGMILVLLLPGIWSAGRTASFLRVKDPGVVVVDEVLGQWVTLTGTALLNGRALIAGFVLFRLFDIWKPWPVRKLEELPGGLGIVADDLAAGVYGALILYIVGSAGLY
jgi:phosphatidylglycerophosphatase A